MPQPPRRVSGFVRVMAHAGPPPGRPRRRSRGPTNGRTPRQAPSGRPRPDRSRSRRSPTNQAPPPAGRPPRTAGQSGRSPQSGAPRGTASAGTRRGWPSSRTSGWWPRVAPPARSSDAWRRWYTVPKMAPRGWFPERLVGDLVVLRRHVPENVAAFRRWYADPEIARLARYQPSPMRPEEIDRFFEARVVGPDALAMAVHERATDRLIGTCAFSQLDGENGSALYHITIGEADAWGHGYGTEATRLMPNHAVGTLSLPRIRQLVF